VEKKFISLSLVLLVGGIHFWLVKDIPFFWDSIQLSSKQAHHFFKSGFTSWALPDYLDSGHPPLLGWYLGALWHFLGRSLWVSHVAFLPFICLYLYYAIRWVCYLVSDNWGRALGLIILCVDPLFVSQSVIMGPDIILIASFSALIFAYVHRQHIVMLVMALFMGLISMRGAMVLASFGIFHILLTFWLNRQGWKDLFSRGWALIPGAAAFVLFLAWHYWSKGWVGFHSGSPWAESFQRVDFAGFLKNVAIFGFRLNEFGRFLIVFLLLSLLGLSKFRLTKAHKKGLLLLVILLLVILPNTLLYQHLSANRYFWPIYLLISLSCISWIGTVKLSVDLLKGGALTTLFVFVAVHWLVYPWKMSQDWEATLVHLPYHQVRNDVTSYMSAMNISRDEVGSAFPALNSDYHIYLTEDQDQVFKDISIGEDKYIFYSNIMNSIKSADLELIETLYWKRHYLQRGLIKGYIFELKEEQ